MRFSRILTYLLPAMILLSCQKELEDIHETSVIPNDPVMTKAVNTPLGSDPSSVLIFMDEAPSDILLENWKEQGIAKVNKLFTSVPGKEEMEARFGLDKWYLVRFDKELPLDEAAQILAREPLVKRLQYNTDILYASDRKVYTYAASEPLGSARSNELPFNDPYLGLQWHYINIGDKGISPTAYAGGDINVKEAWKLIGGDPELVVAIVDEGVMYTHPDLSPNIWTNPDEIPGNNIDDDKNGYVDDVHGYNFVDHGAVSWNKIGDAGHGTHVAGTVAAVNNNGIGVSGVAGGTGKNDGIKMMSCQVFSNSNSSIDAIADAFKYAADNGACIIQCSFGIPDKALALKNDNLYIKENAAEYAALCYFRAHSNYPQVMEGNLCIFASGNESKHQASYPGALMENISVSAFGPDFLPAYYTNFGPGCNITAPGGDFYVGANTDRLRAGVLSTLPDPQNPSSGGYGYMQGTSMACPHVSGIAALGLSYARKLGKKFTAAQMTNMILSASNEFDSRLKGIKKAKTDMQLTDYYHKMGTGSIDTWRLFMQIEGIPTVTVAAGSRQIVDLSDFFGTSAVNLVYLGVEADDASKESLGLETEPEIKFGKLFISPTKVGSGKVKIRAIAGGSNLGGGDHIGGMEISQEVSIIARSFKSSNGGWL